MPSATTTMRTFSSTKTTKMQSTSYTSSGPGPVRNVPSRNTRPVKKRAGYGLFYSDDEEEEDYGVIDVPTTPAPARRPLSSATPTNGSVGPNYDARRSTFSTPAKQVNGNGIKSLVIERKPNNEEDLYGASPAPTPVAHTRRRDSRQTPYRKPTTSDRQKPTLEKEDDIERSIIGASTPSRDARSGKYTMSGAVGSSVTPPQQSSRRGGQPPQTPVRSGSQEVHSTPGGTTWTSWLKKLVTQSVQKVAPSRRESSSNSMELVSTEDSFSSVHSSPAPEDESRLSIPGDFDSVAATSNESEIVPPKVEQRVVNPFLEVEYYNGKIINGDSSNALAFFADSLLSGGGRYSARPSARNARRASAGLSTNRPMFAPRPRFRDSVGVSSVPSSPMGYKRQRTAMNQGPMTEEMKKQIEEERAAEFQRRAEEVERERRDWRIKGQELEYEWRIIQAKLGKPIDDSEDERSESGDSVAAEKPSKGKGKEKDLGTPEKTTGQEMVKLTSSSNESTPEKTVTPPPVRSKPSSFLFGGAAYSADDAPPPPVLEKAAGEKLVAAQTPPAATASPTKKGTDSTKTSFSSDSDKENASKVLSPPATPTLSHAQLPAPLATNAPPPRRSSPTKQATMEAIHKASPIKGGASNLFGDAASKARSQAEKHKPHVSSGLRASTIMSSDSPPRTTKAAAPSFDSPAPQLKGLKPIKEIKEGDIVSQDTMYALAFEVKNHVDQMTIPHGVMLQIPLSSVKKLGMGSMARSRVEKIPTKKQQVDPLKKIILGGVGKLKKLNKA